MEISAFIVDDEEAGVISLSNLLERKHPEVHILATYIDARQVAQAVEAQRPDLVFLDINMPHFNGLELVTQFETHLPKVIFTTAYDEYLLKALRLRVIDYLLKPVRAEELAAALARFETVRGEESTLVENLNHMKLNADLEVIAISSTKGFKLQALAEILYVEGAGSYCVFHTSDGAQMVVSKRLGEIEERLSQTSFFRAHKSSLINLRHVKEYIRGEGGDVLMSNDKVIPLARHRKKAFMEMFFRM